MPLLAPHSLDVNSASLSSKNFDASTKIPVIVCIDVEPDLFRIDRDRPLPWKGFEKLYEFMSSKRSWLSNETESQTHFSWFFRMDPQIAETYGSPEWAAKTYERVIEDLEEKGDEIGLHPHAWRWDEKQKNWIEDHLDQAWLNDCVEMAFNSFEHVLNRKCRSFRFGARFINQEIINLIEQKEVLYDLTLEPGYQEPSSFDIHGSQKIRKGYAIDYSRVPRRFYYPSKTDFKNEDRNNKKSLCIIPLTTGSLHYQYGRAETLYRKFFSPETLNPISLALNLAFEPRHFQKILEESFNKNQNYIATVMRSEIGLSSQKLKCVEENLNYLLSGKNAQQYIFVRPDETINVMKLEKSGINVAS